MSVKVYYLTRDEGRLTHICLFEYHNDKNPLELIEKSSHDSEIAKRDERIAVLEARLEKCKEHFKDLVKDCQWYANMGTEQERHHFLMVESQGNYLDLAISDMDAITIDSLKRGE